MRNSINYKIYGYFAYTTQSIPELSDIDLIQRIKILSKQHHRQCENSCNGAGIVKGQSYYSGMGYGEEAGEYEKKQYGYNVKSAYLSIEMENTVFDTEIENIQEKINALVKDTDFTIKYQHDPRGYTVKLFYKDRNITGILHI
jgi:hypothetical protein